MAHQPVSLVLDDGSAVDALVPLGALRRLLASRVIAVGDDMPPALPVASDPFARRVGMDRAMEKIGKATAELKQLGIL